MTSTKATPPDSSSVILPPPPGGNLILPQNFVPETGQATLNEGFERYSPRRSLHPASDNQKQRSVRSSCGPQKPASLLRFDHEKILPVGFRIENEIPNGFPALPTGLDPRLEAYTRGLMEVAVRDNTPAAREARNKTLLNTLTKLWPQHDLHTILTDPNMYLEPITPPPRTSLGEFRQTLIARNMPEALARQMVVVDIEHINFVGQVIPGQIGVHQSQREPIRQTFKKLLALGFPMTGVVLPHHFGWSDAALGEFNISSGLFPRLVDGSPIIELSDHAAGAAADFNPRLNAYEKKGRVNRSYDPNRPGTLVVDSEVVRIFLGLGYEQGGVWAEPDHQHVYLAGLTYELLGKYEVDET